VRRLTILALLFLTTALGCSHKDQRSDVAVLTGTVRYQGRALGGGTLRAVTAGGTTAGLYQTVIRADGTYRLECPPGPLQLAVETESMKLAGARTVVNPRTKRPEIVYGAGGTSYVEVPAKYADPATSGLATELGLGEQVFNLDLQ
jgi:hypothetical protein